MLSPLIHKRKKMSYTESVHKCFPERFSLPIFVLPVVFFNPIIGKLIVCNQVGFCQYLTLQQNIKQNIYQKREYMEKQPFFPGLNNDRDGIGIPVDLIEDEKKILSRPKREAIWAKIMRYSLARFPNRFRQNRFKM